MKLHFTTSFNTFSSKIVWKTSKKKKKVDKASMENIDTTVTRPNWKNIYKIVTNDKVREAKTGGDIALEADIILQNEISNNLKNRTCILESRRSFEQKNNKLYRQNLRTTD